MPPKNVQVAVLVRPFTNREKEEDYSCIVEAKDGRIEVYNRELDKSKEFNFDLSYWSVKEDSLNYESRTKAVQDLGDRVLSTGFAGYNVCMFSYGASESGKSCAMFGSDTGPGLIPWICKELFERASRYDDDTSFRAEISFLEIHKEFVKDLLGKRRNWQDSLRVREHRELGVYIDKLTKHIITDATEAESLITKGLKNRFVCSRSSDNFFSSSHTVFTIRFTQARLEDGMPSEVLSTIQLVDLAGSRSPHDECSHTNSDCIPEDYDQSLLTLDQVISTLSSKATRNSSEEPPYKNSALTWILKDCFGGNCQTIMLAALSPADICHNETLSTLRYANQVRKVVNYPEINEDGHVKLIKELKVEIQCLRSMLEEGKNKDSAEKQKAERQLHENEELMKRLTGLWEDKWSKTQKLIEERALEVTELGSALKFETEEPHLVSLGGGRLSIGVTICPIKRGKTVVGVSTPDSKPDIELRGKGIESEHCVVEYNGDVVVLHPKAQLCTIDGIPIAEPTKLPQGCMLCLGKSNYFRFNHPKEAKRIREANPGNRFSIVPDGYFPDVELAIEQYKRDKQEKERLKKENSRLLALEQEYKDAVERIENEKAQLEDERNQLLELERLQRDAAVHFENEIAGQIKELEKQKNELQIFEEERARLDMSAEKQQQARQHKEENRKRAYERIEQKRAKLESIQEEDSERVAAELELEEERQHLAMMELDFLVEEVSENEKEHRNMILLDEEREKLDEMKERQNEVVRQLEEELNAQITMLKEERRRENEKIEKEKERIMALEKQQEKALELINLERLRLEEEKQEEKKRIEAEKEKIYQMENERLEALEKIAKDQEKERNLIREEKDRLMELEKKHENSMKELEDSMISKQEKIERERQIEFEFFETEQLLLEELEQKQREAAEQLERERAAMQEMLEKERETEREKIETERKRLQEIQQQQQEALKLAEEERVKLRKQLRSEREIMHREKSRLLKLQHEYKQIRNKGTDNGNGDLILTLTNRNITQIGKECTPEERKKLLEEERRRLLELKKEAEAVLVSKTKKQNGERSSMSSSSSGEDFESASVQSNDSSLKSTESQPLVEELERERQKRRQLESLLEQKNNSKLNGEVVADDKVQELEKALSVERMKRQEMEKALYEKQKQDELDRVAAEEKARKEMLTEKAIQERLPPQVKSPVKDNLNLAQHIVSVGHVLENCPSVKVTTTTCKGYLSKMGGKVRKTWKKRWFVLDRQRKALMYFHDEHKREPKGIIYFQAIQDVYAASWCSNKGPSPRTTFIIKTPQKSYFVAAPSGLAMSIWIDVILTGREGGFYNFQ